MRVPMKAALIGATFVLAGIGVVAVAQPGPRPGGGDRLAALDTDGDGAVSRAEIDAALAEAFARADSDGDGAVTRAELQAHHSAEREQRRADGQRDHFDRADANGDGVLGPDEFGARMTAMFERVDADGDGLVTAEEREEMKQEMRQKMRERRGANRSQ